MSQSSVRKVFVKTTVKIGEVGEVSQSSVRKFFVIMTFKGGEV